MAYKSLDSIVQYCAEHGAAFDEAVLEDDMQERDVTREDSLSSMKSMWQAMKEAASSYDPSLKSASGLSGGQGALMSAYMEQGDTLCGPFINSVI
ncbi:MAG: L-serine ammonia-lyase, iron-sulfur-dependent, subunit alpha, partial [[Clostridium] symbiosum]